MTRGDVVAAHPGRLGAVDGAPALRQDTAMLIGERAPRGGTDPRNRGRGHDQVRLRAAARAKVGPFAEGMLFTRPTGTGHRLQVAAKNAQRYAAADIPGGDSAAVLGPGSVGLPDGTGLYWPSRSTR
jgi:hypothetical protein